MIHSEGTFSLFVIWFTVLLKIHSAYMKLINLFEFIIQEIQANASKYIQVYSKEVEN